MAAVFLWVLWLMPLGVVVDFKLSEIHWHEFCQGFPIWPKQQEKWESIGIRFSSPLKRHAQRERKVIGACFPGMDGRREEDKSINHGAH